MDLLRRLKGKFGETVFLSQLNQVLDQPGFDQRIRPENHRYVLGVLFLLFVNTGFLFELGPELQYGDLLAVVEDVGFGVGDFTLLIPVETDIQNQFIGGFDFRRLGQ